MCAHFATTHPLISTQRIFSLGAYIHVSRACIPQGCEGPGKCARPGWWCRDDMVRADIICRTRARGVVSVVAIRIVYIVCARDVIDIIRALRWKCLRAQTQIRLWHKNYMRTEEYMYVAAAAATTRMCLINFVYAYQRRARNVKDARCGCC